MGRAEIPASIWARNLAATIVGLLFVAAAVRTLDTHRGGSGRWSWFMAVGVVVLGGTLLFPGTEGIHRWLPLGPLRIHAGAVLLPPILVMLDRLAPRASAATVVSILLILLMQPDAAQAASFGAGVLILLATALKRSSIGVVGLCAILVAATLLRNDPLQPIPHVEGIVGMAAAQSPGWAAASLASLAILPVAYLLIPSRRVGAALAVYTTGTLVGAWLGHYPVPVLGYGVSPILGIYLAVAVLIPVTSWRPE